VLLVASWLVACSGEPASVAVPDPVVAPPAVPAPAGEPIPPADDEFVATFRTLIDACNAWNVQVGNKAAGELSFDGGANDPTRTLKVVERRGTTAAVLEDADGGRLVIDLLAKTVSAADGATVPLPIRYTFCPHETFLGPAVD
jgi:hypothetical protein